MNTMKHLWDLIKQLFRRSKPDVSKIPDPTPLVSSPTKNGEDEKVAVGKVTEGTTTFPGIHPTTPTEPSLPNDTSTLKATTPPEQPKTPKPPPTSATHLNQPGGKPKASNVHQGEKGEEVGEKQPPSIPGRRSNQTDTPENPPRSKPKTKPEAKPELICREQGQRINIVLSIPTKLELNDVRQNETSLINNNNEYTIENLSEPIIIQTTNNTEEIIPLAGNKFLIFKTGNNWNGDGRQISSFTKGFFIVVTPSNWNREGQPTVEPSPCSDKNYIAHFFEVDPADHFNTYFFKECKTPPQRQKIFLEGNTIPDNSEQGLLFVQQPPKLRDISEIIWVRVGKEDTDAKEQGGYNFMIAEDSLEKIIANQCGRFYIRVYNEKVNLIDSDEFRYCPDLKEILVDERCYNPEILLPPLQKGYELSKLKFIGKSDQPLPCLKKNGVTNRSSQKSPEAIKPSPDEDRTTWILETKRGQVEVVINLPRIWWRLEPSDEMYWHDKPITITREGFKSLELKDTKIILKVPSYIKYIKTGFNNDLDREIPIKEGISFTAFVHYNQIAKAQSQPSHLQIAWEDTVITVLTIVADQVLDDSKDGDKDAPEKEDLNRIDKKGTPAIGGISKLRPSVKTANSKTRQGKGFSTGEITSVNSNIKECRTLGIYVDRRRRTVHPGNIKRLKGYINADD